MSVIAKMIVRSVHNFGSGSLVELSCICDNDLMTAYAESHEDKLFTKYSPWGEIKLHLQAGWALTENAHYYVMITNKEETSNTSFPGAVLYQGLRVMSITDFGDNQYKKLEMTDFKDANVKGKGINSLNWKMSVDNPSATNQLKPGTSDYWVAFYPASMGRDAVIEKAHS